MDPFALPNLKDERKRIDEMKAIAREQTRIQCLKESAEKYERERQQRITEVKNLLTPAIHEAVKNGATSARVPYGHDKLNPEKEVYDWIKASGGTLKYDHIDNSGEYNYSVSGTGELVVTW